MWIWIQVARWDQPLKVQWCSTVHIVLYTNLVNMLLYILAGIWSPQIVEYVHRFNFQSSLHSQMCYCCIKELMFFILLKISLVNFKEQEVTMVKGVVGKWIHTVIHVICSHSHNFLESFDTECIFTKQIFSHSLLSISCPSTNELFHCVSLDRCAIKLSLSFRESSCKISHLVWFEY